MNRGNSMMSRYRVRQGMRCAGQADVCGTNSTNVVMYGPAESKIVTIQRNESTINCSSLSKMKTAIKTAYK